jgi:hypothetical protein
MLTHDVGQLEQRAIELRGLLQRLGEDDWDELIPIWKRPGWTTPAEFRFAAAIIESMMQQAEQLGALKGGLLEGSREVEG